MCGRFNLRTGNRQLQEIFHADPAPGLFDFEPRYNIAPMAPIAVVRAKFDELGRDLTALKWGLVPFWADDPKYGNRCMNARADGIDKKASFREPLKKAPLHRAGTANGAYRRTRGSRGLPGCTAC